MKTTNTFEFKTRHGLPVSGCAFRVARYRSTGNLALQVVDAEGVVCTCSVNPDEKLGDDVLCVKDYSENEGVLDELRRLGVVGEVVQTIPSGWVEFKVAELTEQGKELFEDV